MTASRGSSATGPDSSAASGEGSATRRRFSLVLGESRATANESWPAGDQGPATSHESNSTSRSLALARAEPEMRSEDSRLLRLENPAYPISPLRTSGAEAAPLILVLSAARRGRERASIEQAAGGVPGTTTAWASIAESCLAMVPIYKGQRPFSPFLRARNRDRLATENIKHINNLGVHPLFPNHLRYSSFKITNFSDFRSASDCPILNRDSIFCEGPRAAGEETVRVRIMCLL